MNIEELRTYCLSLETVEEKFPFAKIKGGESVLVFYVCNHMFAMVDLDDSDIVNIKCQPERGRQSFTHEQQVLAWNAFKWRTG